MTAAGAKPRSRAFGKIMAGLEDALAYAEGDTSRGREFIVHVDPRAVRKKLGLSQAEFASRFFLNLRTVQDWELGRTQPHGTARVLLAIIDREPEAVRRALASYRHEAGSRQGSTSQRRSA